MKIHIITGLLLALSIVSGNIQAQDKLWTLQECVDYAVQNSIKVSNQTATNEIARHDRKQAVAGLFPSFSASTSAQFSFGRGLSDNNTYSNVNSFTNNYGLSGSVVLFDGLSSFYRVKMASVSVQSGVHELQRIKDDVAFAAMEAFLNVQGCLETVELAREQLEESRRNRHMLERMVELGMKGFPDLAEMKAQEAAAQYTLTQQQNQLDLSIIRIREVMNLPVDCDFQLEPYISEVQVLRPETDVNGLYAFSSQHHPLAQSADLNLRYYELSHRSYKGNLYPRLSMGGGFNTTFFRYMDGKEYQAFGKQLENRRGHYISFNLSIPLFNGFTASSNIKKSRYQVAIARNNRDETYRALYTAIEEAVVDMTGQADQYMHAVRQVEAMSIAYEVSRRRYEEGVESPLDLHTNSNRLLKARVEEKRALLSFYLKQKLVDYYTGIPVYNEK